MKKLSFFLMLLFVTTISLSSCRETKSTEDKMEDGIEEVGDEVEEAAEDVEEEVEDAVDDN